MALNINFILSIKKDLTYNRVWYIIDSFVDNGEGHHGSMIGNKCRFLMIKGLDPKRKYVLY